MPIEQREAWQAVFEIHDSMPQGWVDVLIPRHLGERAEKRRGVTGGTTIAAPASQQALDRSETVEVRAGSASGRVIRPTLLGSLIGKAGALTIINDPRRRRHIDDFLSLASVVRASDLRGVTYQPAERDHLANMLGRLANEPELMDQFPEAGEGVERLRLSLS